MHRSAPPGTATRTRRWHRAAIVAALLFVLVSPVLPTALPAVAASPDLVISQIYGGGGNSGAPYTHDFIELLNRGTAPASLAGRSLQYASATGTGNLGATATQLTELPAVTLQPGQYYLIQEATQAAVGQPLPAPDLIDPTPIAMSGTAGKVALVNSAAPLGCNGGSTPCSPAQLALIVDLVGYGGANFFEGPGAAPAPSNTTADRRVADGCVDTDNNAADFAAAAPAPRNAASPVATCDAHPSPTPTPTPTPTPMPSPSPVPGDLRIRDIQGAAHLSPLDGRAVAGVPGVVTAVRANGFYLQDPAPDDNPATSEAIFVFTSSAPAVAVGDSVLVGGTVDEFRPGGSGGADNLTTTEIVGPAVVVGAPGTPLPAATVIGAGGRVPPTTTIDDDATGSVETSGTFDPAADGIDFYESLEAMLVRVDGAVAVGPASAFGEIPVLADGGAGAGVRTTRGGIVIRPGDFNPERILLDDTLAPVPTVDVGDGLGSVVGVLDYSFGNFKLLAIATPAVTPGGLAREVTAPAAPGELAIATFNVENLDPGDPPAKFAALAAIIVGNLRAPDIIALEEVQDNTGPTNDGTVAADQTYARLIAAIVAAGGPAYDFRQIDPVNNQDGGEPGGNIRVGFLFRADRGVAFVDRPGGCPTCAVGVAGTGPATRLTTSPGRIAPTDPAFANSRKPLAGEFTYRGRTLFVVANHFNSKGGDDPLFGQVQPPVRGSEAQRRAQAALVNAFVDDLLAADPAANVAVLGDINDFQFSDVMGILAGGVLTPLIDTLPLPERYSYVFEGNSQALDHILVSAALLDRLAAYDIVHVNAEFADQVSDHDPQVARFAFRAAPVARDVAATTAEDTPVAIALDASDADGDPLTYTIVAGPGNGTLAANGGTVTYTPAANFGGTDTFTYRAGDGTADSNVATVTLTVTPVNDAPTVAVVGAAGRCGNAGGTFALRVADPDNDPSGLTLAATSSDPALVPAGGLTPGGTGAARTLAIALHGKRDGTATITVTVGDGRATGSLTITVIVGGNGADTLVGTDGADLLLGGNGTDTLGSGGGPDLLCSGNGADTLDGGAGDDSLDGGNGGDRLVGGPGADRFAGGNGIDTAPDFAPADGDTADGTIP